MPSPLLAPAVSEARTTIDSFRQEQGMCVGVPCIAPAGPACLNNNAPFRRGRTHLFSSASRTFAPARHTRTEASAR
jgi:hypothetical protein